eukprot:jgi/Mesen1/523/ME000104S10615
MAGEKDPSMSSDQRPRYTYSITDVNPPSVPPGGLPATGGGVTAFSSSQTPPLTNPAQGEPAIGIPYAPNQQGLASNQGYVQGNSSFQSYAPNSNFQGSYPPGGYQPTMAPPQSNIMHIQTQQGPFYDSAIPTGAIVNHPGALNIRETFYGDTPAPFQCPNCGQKGLTNVRSSLSVAACLGCVITMEAAFGINNTIAQPAVGEFRKNDPCAVVDPPQWTRPSYAFLV